MKKIYDKSWKKIIEREINSEYFGLIESFIEAEK
jgi:hypothetical protein